MEDHACEKDMREDSRGRPCIQEDQIFEKILTHTRRSEWKIGHAGRSERKTTYAEGSDVEDHTYKKIEQAGRSGGRPHMQEDQTCEKIRVENYSYGKIEIEDHTCRRIQVEDHAARKISPNG